MLLAAWSLVWKSCAAACRSFCNEETALGVDGEAYLCYTVSHVVVGDADLRQLAVRLYEAANVVDIAVRLTWLSVGVRKEVTLLRCKCCKGCTRMRIGNAH